MICNTATIMLTDSPNSPPKSWSFTSRPNSRSDPREKRSFSLLFEPEGLHDGLRAVVLRRDRVGGPELFLYGEAAFPRTRRHDPVHDADERCADDHDDSEERVEHDENDRRHDHGEQLEQAFSDRPREGALELTDVGEQPRQHVAFLLAAEPTGRQRLEVREHVDPEITRHRTAHVRGEVRAAQSGEQRHDESDCENAENLHDFDRSPDHG